jgi:hypothetical protein
MSGDEESGVNPLRNFDTARVSTRSFNEAVEKMRHDQAVKTAIREGRYDPDMVEMRGRQNVADMIIGLADLVRNAEAWVRTFTTEGPDGKPYLLRLKEA